LRVSQHESYLNTQWIFLSGCQILFAKLMEFRTWNWIRTPGMEFQCNISTKFFQNQILTIAKRSTELVFFVANIHLYLIQLLHFVYNGNNYWTLWEFHSMIDIWILKEFPWVDAKFFKKLMEFRTWNWIRIPGMEFQCNIH